VAEPPRAGDGEGAALPETTFAGRVRPLESERSFPLRRRAIFFDVENTSRPEHIARMIDHLAVDRHNQHTEFIAVGNWKVIGHDTARLLSRHGAQLIHSAPSAGVRDWSDLRIAVSAGAWLAGARPGDVLEIVSADRAFDAVGDVAAGLGIAFRRISYRGLAGLPVEEEPAREPHEPADLASRSRRRGRRRRGRPAPHPAHGPGGRLPHAGEPAAAPVAPSAPSRVAPPPAPAPHVSVPAHVPAAPVAAPSIPLPSAPISDNGAEAPAEPHTASHDEIVMVARDLIAGSPTGGVTIDALANALKSRGFRRTPGSPRLITRLRRIRELALSQAGMITLVPGHPVRPASAAQPAPSAVEEPTFDEISDEAAERSALERAALEPGPPVGPQGPRSGRRRRARGGRRRGPSRHRGRGPGPAASEVG
jgi:hypothetical protein